MWSPVRLPKLPRRATAFEERFQVVLVLQCVHRRPEAFIAVGANLFRLDQPAEGAVDQIFAFLDEVEDPAVEDEEAAVDPDVRRRDVLDAADQAAALHLDRVERVVGRPHAQERRDVLVRVVARHHIGKRRISQAVAVRRKEGLVLAEVLPHRAETLPDAAVQARVHERDAPVVDVAADQLDALAALREHEVVAQRLVVVEEEVLDRLGAMAQADDEVLVPEVGVVLHDVPQDRPVPDRDHRLRDAAGAVAHPQAEPAAEEHHLHAITSSAGIAMTKRPPQSRA